MHSKAETVPAYLDDVADDVRPTLKKVRALIRKVAKGAKESMQYGMPSYDFDGTMFCSFALQKGYLAFYLCDTDTVARFRAELGTKDCGKSCIRYRKPEAIPLPVIERMLKAAMDKRNSVKKA